jgi:O-antigen/teichoic acid export membrane protein
MRDAFSIEHSLSKQMMWIFSGRIIAFSFAFILPLVLVRIFSQAEFGLYKQLFLIAATVTSILSLGLPASLFYFVPNHLSERHGYIFQTLVVLACLGILGGGVLVTLKSQVAAAFNNPDLEHLIPYVGVFCVLYLTTVILETLMIILKQPKLSALAVVSSEILRAGILIAFAVWTQSVVGVLVAAILWGACRLLSLVAYLQHLDMPWKLMLDKNRLAGQFRYAAPFGVALILATLTEALPQYAVSYLYNPSVFAIYSIGYLQIPLVAITFETISDVTLVRITELRKECRFDEAVSIIGESVTKLWMLLLPLSVFLFINARDFIHLLFTDRFDASVEIFRIFLFAVPLTALGLDYVPRAFADTAFVFRIKAVAFLLTAGLLVVLLGPLGLVGAAVATVLVTLTMKVIIMLKVRNLFKVSIRSILPWKRLLYIGAATAAAGVCAVAVQSMVNGAGLRLFLCGIAFTTTYGLILWYGDMLGPEIRRRILEVGNVGTKYRLGNSVPKAKRIGL